MPAWLSGDSTTFVKWYTNTGGSSPSAGSFNNRFYMMFYFCNYPYLIHEFRRQIEYKAKWSERKVIFADTFFASSKLCSCCGWKNSDLKLTDRVFECKVCDMKMDRDLNASLNLKQIYTGSSSEIQACGDGNSSANESSLLSPSVKQEFNKKSRVYILKV